ncbi:MAG: hypothetical protein JSS79_11305 [Bacteroidetes bacterium]|nr:hypothetical protein [Bacteroidota bacterium]
MERKLLRYGYFVHICAWLLVPVFIFIVMPRWGMTLADLNDGQVVLDTLEQHPLLVVFPGLDLALGLSLMIVTVALHRQLENSVWNDLQKIFGLIAGMLFIYGAFSRITTFANLIVDPHVEELRFFGYSVVNYLQLGNSHAVQFFLAAWLVTSNALRFTTGKRSVLLFIIIMMSVVSLLAPFLAPIAGVLMITNLTSSIYWIAKA